MFALFLLLLFLLVLTVFFCSFFACSFSLLFLFVILTILFHFVWLILLHFVFDSIMPYPPPPSLSLSLSWCVIKCWWLCDYNTMKWIREAALWVCVKLQESALNTVLIWPGQLGLEQLQRCLLALKCKCVFSALLKFATLTSLVSFFQASPPLITPNYIRPFTVTIANSPLFSVFTSSDSSVFEVNI